MARVKMPFLKRKRIAKFGCEGGSGSPDMYFERLVDGHRGLDQPVYMYNHETRCSKNSVLVFLQPGPHCVVISPIVHEIMPALKNDFSWNEVD